MTAVFIGGVAVLYLVLLAGLIIVPLGLPGNWIMLAAAGVFALFGELNPGSSEWTALIIIAALAGVGELIELGVRIVGGKLAKVSNGAIIAAIVGGLLGVFIGVPIFLIGSIIGLLVGVFMGAFLYALIFEKATAGGAIKTAFATLCSQVVALFAKTCIGVGIIVYISFLLF